MLLPVKRGWLRGWSRRASVVGETTCPLFGEFGGAASLLIHLIVASGVGGSGEVSIGGSDGEIWRRVVARRDPSCVEPLGMGTGQVIDELLYTGGDERVDARERPL